MMRTIIRLSPPCDVWHSRLNHLNYNFMQRLTNHELLPRIIFEKTIISVKFMEN
jgi:hypothetical protein